MFVVSVIDADYRNVPDGIEIVENSWYLENDSWLSMRSSDMSQNVLVPTQSISWGAIKALCR